MNRLSIAVKYVIKLVKKFNLIKTSSINFYWIITLHFVFLNYPLSCKKYTSLLFTLLLYHR